MTKTILDKELVKLFGLSDMPEGDRDTFLEDVGALIIEGTITRLVADLEGDDIEKVRVLIGATHDTETLLKVIESEYPQTNNLFREEIESFRKEALEISGK